MSKKFFIDFDEVGNEWALSAKFPPVEEDILEYETAIRRLVEYLNALVERDTGRAGAVTFRIEEI